MFLFYSFLLTVGFILLLPMFLLKREKYISGFWQRFGKLPKFEQGDRKVLWLHCVSVGETNAAQPLVNEIVTHFPEYRLVVSTTTKTGQELAKKLFKDKAELVFYFPFDWKFTVKRALRTIKPSVVLLMETELWFNFLRQTSKSGARIAIVNGRLSEKSFTRYSYLKRTMQRVLHYIDLALMQGRADAKRFIDLGIRSSKVKITGNIKFDQDFAENNLTDDFRARFAITENSPLIVAASTHAPEETLILQAFKDVWKNSVSDKLPRLLIAPRHPERFAEVGELIEKSGFDWVKRSENESSRDKSAEIILLDSIGELRAIYSLAELVFVGGSLIPHGGQSILEPALARKAIVTGFYTMNFTEIVREFSNQNALIQLPKNGESKLVEVFAELLQDVEKREKLAANAFAVMKKNRGATAKTIEHLKDFLR
ncbi:MAG TPA: 3-deoxy-D-manno-octulosonic acid transferase [Pyrinomonadaceae bacterium]|nr:3-deoxy-D-manno-octulosonic acid transferase [Pyrinomonadaceae bacterium]